MEGHGNGQPGLTGICPLFFSSFFVILRWNELRIWGLGFKSLRARQILDWH